VKPNKPYVNTFVNRCAQFERDEQKTPTPVIPTPAPPIEEKITCNPYSIARTRVLAGYEPWRRYEVLTLETSKDLDNAHYTSFVKDVANLGDTLTDAPKK
jgi:hypothetical protein